MPRNKQNRKERDPMERMREDLIRRAQLERLGRAGDVEQAMPEEPLVVEDSTRPARRFSISRPQLPRLFGLGQPPARPVGWENAEHADIYGPKSPPFRFEFDPVEPEGPYRRMADAAYVNGDADQFERGPAPEMEPDPVQSMPRRPEAAANVNLPAATAAFDAPDPESFHLAMLAEEGRRGREVRKQHREEERRARHGPRRHKRHPKHFLYCFPWVKSQRVRIQILRALVSGMFILLMLAIFLGLSINHDIDVSNSGLTVILSMVLVLGGLFFGYSVFRICRLLARKGRRHGRSRRPEMMVAGGYAVPKEPIAVMMDCGEDNAHLPQKNGPATPPAYGRWRESVRVDPDRFFWQRTEDVPPMPMHNMGEVNVQGRPGGRSVPRPPSYVSEDGVSYVMDAAPRSTVPPIAVPQPAFAPHAARADSVLSSVYSAVQL